MSKLYGLPANHLRAALDEAGDAKVAKRLMVALAYTDGVLVETVTEQYGMPQSTTPYWLDRFDNRPTADALHDGPSPGRPPKLSTDKHAVGEAGVDKPYREYEYNAIIWSDEHLFDRIHGFFDVENSEAHI